MARELGQRGLGHMEVPLVSPHEERQEPRVSPEATAGPWNTLTFGWLSNIIAEGYRREVLRQRGPQPDGRAPLVQEGQRDEPPQALMEEDLLELRPDDRPEILGERMQAKWDEQERRPPDSRSLRNALFMAFGGTFAVGGAFKFVYDTLQMVGPYVLKRFLAYLNECDAELHDHEECSAEEGLGWVAVIFVSSLVQTAVLHQYFHRCFRTGMRFNAAAISLIYKKSLCIAGPGKLADDKKKSPGAPNGQRPQSPQQGEQPAQGAQQPQQQRTSGEIVNLMAVDSQRLQDTMAYLHTLWSGPYQITITLIFLFYVVKWATLAGLAIMMLQVPLVAFVSRRVKLAQRELMKVKDERVKVTNETFGSIRLLKMYGWEDSFEQRLTGIRDRELHYLRRYQLLNIISSAMWSVAPILTGVATFGVYTAFYGELSAATAFSALSLFNVLRFPLTMFPNMVTSAVEANVALKRIEDFLGSPEIRGRPGPPPIEYAQTAGARLAVRLQKAKFEWPGGVPLLSDVTFSVPAPVPDQARAHMTVIIGAVGVGKSGLLQALIGDLGPVSGEGSVAVSGSIAYAAQVAWIRNATIKDNILFNSPYDEQRYLAVVKACQLIPDLQQLDHGEMTEIGEKGVNLSGGQKQRVALARAVYAGADLLLLDDPLSAVDSEVAKKLLAMLAGELVRKSSIVLCTHHLGALRYADQVILLERVKGEDGMGAASPSRPSTESRVAFCGRPEDFREEYPQMWAHGDEALTRQASGEDMASIQAKVKGVGKADGGRLVQREAEQQGAVGWHVYKTYIDYAGGTPMAVAVCLGLLFGQACQTGADTWVSFWSDHSKEGSDPHVSSGFGLLGYVITSFAAFFGIIGTSFLFRTTALRAAKAFHQQLLHNMLKLPQRFYDTTPQGRVLNRFSKDVYTVDEQLVSILMMYFQTMCRVLATIVVITFATPWFLVIIIPLLVVYRHTQNYYVPSSRQLKRIESNLRSPIFSHFGETLDGVASIRAFGQQRQFITESTAKIQKSMRAYYLNVASNRWLAVRLETLGTFIVAAASLLAVLARDTITAGVAGLSISYALSVTQALNWVVRMTSDRETNIVSVERLAEYIRETTEPPRRDPLDPRPGEWPRQGKVEFFGVRMRYRAGLPLVLDGLDLEVAAREKLGICGRTGAGKSSLLNVLLRIVDPEEGRVVIDGLNTLTLGLHTLRRSITVLPQDPVLFSGTLRFNLDPLSECTDSMIWQALQRSNLAGHAQALANQAASHAASASGASSTANGAEPGISDCLNAVVAEKGENFSLGQRQQLCLARALLRSNKILLLDEATSAVDVETDAQIQETIRKEFSGHTVFCIAHRISTIMSYDRICVVEGGKVAELGPPQELRNKPDSRFKALAENDSSR